MQLIRSKKIKLSMDLAPLIDVVFLLLIFFMLTSNFASPAIKMILPKAVITDTTAASPIIVSVNLSGQIFVNDQKVSLDQLKSKLSLLLDSRDDKSINIRGDQDMAYRHFVEVMDVAKQAGAEHINVVHQSINP